MRRAAVALVAFGLGGCASGSTGRESGADESASNADTAPPRDSAADTGDRDSAGNADTARDTGDSATGTDSAGDPTPDATGPAPTMGDPFVIDGCGYQDGEVELYPVPDLDGDGEEDLLVVVPDTPEVYGTWFVPAGSSTMPYWDQPLHWTVDGTVTTTPDLDGDGVPEVYSVGGGTVTRLLPDGTASAWTGVPTAFAPWHDVNGDGVDELIVGAPALSADGVTTGYVAVVATGGADPTGWTVLAAVVGDGLGAALEPSTADHDGDGYSELYATDANDGHLLASGVLDRGGALADATLATFSAVAGRAPVAIGDADGGGTEDVVFPPPTWFSYARLFAGERPASPVDWGGPGTFGDVGTMRVGPDGAGGLLLWAEYGELSGYSLGDLLDGVTSARISGWAALSSAGLASTDTALWTTPWNLGSPWETRVRAARVDPSTADGVLAEVEGGGPGYGGDAVAAALDDLDGDGLLDWWQISEGTLTYHPLVPGAEVTVCDGSSADVSEWSAAQAGDDLDADGVPELVWWGEPSSTGVWSAPRGAITTYGDFDGALTQLGCDVTGDGVDELQFTTFGRNYLVDGVRWLASGGAPSSLSHVEDDAVCLGDLDGDGISEIAATYTDLKVYSGASIGAGPPVVLATVEGPKLGRVVALGDIDGDALGDLSFYAFDARNATCILTAADLLATPTRPLADVPCGDYASYIPADVDGDGVNELLTTETDTITAWWPASDAREVVWTSADDSRDEPLLGLLRDAFGPGRAAVVLGPEPVVVYALE